MSVGVPAGSRDAFTHCNPGLSHVRHSRHRGVGRPFHHRLLKSLRKRGPDEIGFWSDECVQLAHARLAIIGLDERGRRAARERPHVLVYNGEIYNFNEIRRQLNAAGVR